MHQNIIIIVLLSLNGSEKEHTFNLQVIRIPLHSFDFLVLRKMIK